jgi:hypothetical protein
MRSIPGQPPALEAVPPSSIESMPFTSESWDVRSSSTQNLSSNIVAQSSSHKSVRVSNAVPPLDLSGLRSIITTQQIQPFRKTKFDQIPWPPRIPRAPRLLVQPSPAGPTPTIGASRGSESERHLKSSSLAPASVSSWSARKPTLANFSDGQDSARSKVALVVAQGMEVQNAGSMPIICSTVRSLGSRDHVCSAMPSVPSASLAPKFKTTSLFAIEVTRLHFLEFMLCIINFEFI